MCFFSLHNECPPVNYATAEAMKVTDGLVAGERATAETLRAIADCVTAMACIVGVSTSINPRSAITLRNAVMIFDRPRNVWSDSGLVNRST